MSIVAALALGLVVAVAFLMMMRSRPRPPKAPPAEVSEENIRLLVAQGKTINAIKMYRELTGVGLKEAKDAIDALAAGGSLERPAPREVGPGLDDELRALKAAGKMIDAIKLYRTASGAGLKESKEYVEALG